MAPMKTVSVSAAQDMLPELLRSETITFVTRKGAPAGYIVPYERMQAIAETMEILANPKAMRATREADNPSVRWVPLEAIK